MMSALSDALFGGAIVFIVDGHFGAGVVTLVISLVAWIGSK